MKKFFLVFSVISLFVVFGLAACTTNKTSNEGKNTETKTEEGAKSKDPYTDEQKKTRLNDLTKEIDQLSEQVNKLEDVKNADVVFE